MKIKNKKFNYNNFIILIPFLWLTIFFALPLIEIIEVSLSIPKRGIPPYQKIFEIDNFSITFNPNFSNYFFIWKNKSELFFPILNSFKLSFTSTVLCLLIGYPIAFWIAGSSRRMKIILLIMILLPFWISSLIKIYAIMNFLGKYGILNSILIKLNIIKYPLNLMRTDISIYYGMIISYLPLMVLPILSSLSKIDKDIYEVASDLGASSFVQFITLTLSLSLAGIFAGFLLVFIPSFGEFVIPELLGGSNQIMIGKLLWTEFFRSRDWPFASSLAIILLIFLTIPIILLRSIYNRQGSI